MEYMWLMEVDVMLLHATEDNLDGKTMNKNHSNGKRHKQHKAEE